jgi:predicted nucleic acid-binding protein
VYGCQSWVLITEAAQDIMRPAERPSGVCREKDNGNVLACALEAAADYLVTGDNDFLHLKLFKGIIAPREFELLFDS